MIDINFLGHACFKIRAKNTTFLIDPFSPKEVGLRMEKTKADAVLITHHHPDHFCLERVFDYRLIIDGPGEYEIGGYQIFGFPSYHDKEKGEKRGSNTIYQIKAEDLSLVHLGDLGHKLDDNLIEQLNGVDVLFIPVGGNYTISPDEAVEIVNQIEPLIIVPMHYFSPGLKIEDIEPVDKFLKELGVTKADRLPKLSLSKDKLPEETKTIILDLPK